MLGRVEDPANLLVVLATMPENVYPREGSFNNNEF
jgi:hypothetical protein